MKILASAFKRRGATSIISIIMSSKSVAFVGISKEVGDRPNNFSILNNVSGYCHEKEITCVLGPSGSGKTTLLDALGGRNIRGVTGSVYLNGESLNKKHRRAIVYVTQESSFFPSTFLTVRDHLLFAAAMRFDSSKTTAKMYEKEVDIMVQSLALSKCVDTPCILVSGGERRRCSIGCELLCPQPLLLLIDEATSGLDSSAAASLIRRIRDLTMKKRVPTLMTIHSPSSEIFSSFDKVIFLSDGKMVYDGPPSGVMYYLTNLGFSPTPLGRAGSASDFMLGLLCSDEDNDEDTYSHTFSESRLDLPRALQLSDISLMSPKEILIKAFDNDSTHLNEVIKARDSSIEARQRRRLRGRGRSQTVSGPVSTTALQDQGGECKEEGRGLMPSASQTQTRAHTTCPPSVVLGAVHELTAARRTRHFGAPASEWVVGRENNQEQRTISSEDDCGTGERRVGEDSSLAEVWAGDTYVTSFSAQFFALLARSSKQNQSVRFTWLNVSQTAILALLIGAAWFNLPLTEDRLEDLLGLLFFTSTYIFFASTFSAVMEFLPERPILKRERESKLYHLSAYFLSKCLSTLPVRLVLTTLLFTVAYVMAIYSYLDVQTYFMILAVLLLVALVGESVGMFIGTLTVSFDKALAITTIATLAILLLGGFYVKNLPTWLRWLKYTSPLRYGYAAVVQIHIGRSPPMMCNDNVIFSECVEDPLSGAFYVPNSQVVVDNSGFGSQSILENCLVLLLFLVVLRTATYLSLRFLKLNLGGRQ